MIPATSITFNDDPAGEPASTGTAWWTFQGDVQQINGIDDVIWDLDRPCDTCGGETAERHGEDYLTHPCSDCINGRHTFTINVVCGGCYNNSCVDGVRSLRVSIVPGMILPIGDQEDGCPDTPHVCVFHGRMGGEPHNQWTLFGADGMEDELDPFPPDAKPGGWAAQLLVTT